MQSLYSYNKYYAVDYYNLGWSCISSSESYAWGYGPVTGSYSINNYIGSINLVGYDINPNNYGVQLVNYQNATLYNIYNGELLRIDIGKFTRYNSSGFALCNCNIYKAILSNNPIKGSFITTIQAVEGMYPNSGKFTDGYWYEKSTLVTRVPEFVITSPSQNGTISKLC